MTLKEAEVLALSTLKQVMEEKVIHACRLHLPGRCCNVPSFARYRDTVDSSTTLKLAKRSADIVSLLIACGLRCASR